MPPPYSNGKQYNGNYWKTCTNCSVKFTNGYPVLKCCCQEDNKKDCKVGCGIKLSNPPSNTNIQNCDGDLRWESYTC